MSVYTEDKELVLQCIAGKRIAQHLVYTKYHQAMYNLCLRMVRDINDAEDVLQMSFVQVFNKIQAYRYESTLGAWIKRIVVNHCINHIKKNKIQFEILDDNEVPYEHDEPQTYNIEGIKKAIKNLPDGYRIIFCLYTLEGYDHAEIAEILNISESTSKSQYSRAKIKLIKILRDNGEINNIYS